MNDSYLYRPGVYAITNRLTGEQYIGVSRNVGRRFTQHRAALRRGISGHALLQNAWCLWGEGAFTFELLEPLEDMAQAQEVEQRWMDHAPALYNRTAQAGQPRDFMRAPDVREHLSARAKERAQRPEIRARLLTHMAKGHAPGVDNPRAILTEAMVRDILACAGKEPQTVIARRFGISQARVSKIVRGEAWPHIPRP